MSNIYDDVELLQTEVEALKTKVATLYPTILTAGADIHALDIGEYIIPNATVCATLVNKPTSRTATGYVSVISCGDSGQKIVKYTLCDRTSVITYYAAYYTETWGAWIEINSSDSGWLDLPLASGITAYNESQKPRYRRVGKTVFLSGVIKGVTASDVTVATLPNGYRPSKRVIVPIACVGQMIGKVSIDTDGSIILNRTTVEPVIAENWHSIACCFEG